MSLTQRRAVSTRALTDSFGNFNSFEQHDAQELCRKMFEHLDDLQQQMESEAENSSASATLDDIFAGTAVNYLKSMSTDHNRQVPEKFLDLEVWAGT